MYKKKSFAKYLSFTIQWIYFVFIADITPSLGHMNNTIKGKLYDDINNKLVYYKTFMQKLKNSN